MLEDSRRISIFANLHVSHVTSFQVQGTRALVRTRPRALRNICRRCK